ncbi:hypothetical protein ACHAPO_009043 [Fusarium lateritium]
MSNSQTASFDDRFKRAWTLFEENKRDEARAVAAELLRETHIGPFHQAGMRMIMMLTPSAQMHQHRFEAFRLWTDKGADRMSDAEKAEIGRLLQQGQKVAQSWAEQEIQKKLDNGWTKEQLKDLEKATWEKFIKGEKLPHVVYQEDECLPGTFKYTKKDS